ncbi:hypothetical protein ABFS82_04G149100 [Erythranthe guttata]|uniref:uncharacterized protein LOC105973464 n=1 Tax=Erythranthe guttata TaxID=4155 RepID=UPI00064DA87F|nr:PREDICTED: uncharacterized protein LOC105973464 [Erythranthe guttata]|eukprot:XP_012853942.1 PREDICTED: uncharacterized protein LOC105973464 [Erythranthe guttata]
MPGNENGDRVHNFFAQENSSQGQQQSHIGNWPVQNNNFWVGSQRQSDIVTSSSKNYSSQNSDRLQASYPVNAAHSLNFSQSNPRPDFSKNQSLNEQQPSNGFMYGNQFYQTRQNEPNFLAMDTDSDQRHLHQQSGQEQAKSSGRSETSGAPVSFDLFGGQQQMSHQQANMLQALQRQQSGFNDMQQLQQQLMIRKMQELQSQQQNWQLDLMPQNMVSQVPPYTEEASGSLSSTRVNGSPNSDTLQHPWAAEPGKNWLTRGSSGMQRSSSGLGFSPNPGQTQHLPDVVPQQVDQSLYGVPVSGSRGLAANQYSQMVTDRSSIPQLATSGSSHGSRRNFLPDQIGHNFLPDQIGGQEETFISRQKFQNAQFEHASSQSLNTRTMDIGMQVNSMQRNASQQDLSRRQELAAQTETSHEIHPRQVSESWNEVALDPSEEKILYGSDDNIWAAFGKSPNMGGEAGNLFDDGGSSNGFPSIQSGSWSALMQSAVAETSSSDIRAQDEWSGLNNHNPDSSSAIQPHSTHNKIVKQAFISSDSTRIPSALSSGSNPPSDNLNMGLNQLGHKFQNGPYQRVPTDTFRRLGQPLEEAREWSNRTSLQRSVADGSQIYGNASQHSLSAERNAKILSGTLAPRQSGTRQPPNGWNALAAVSHGGDRLLNIDEAEKLSQNSQNHQVRVMQGEVHENSLWKSNSVTGSAIQFGSVQPTLGNSQENIGALSLNDATASVANSRNMGFADGTGAFVQSKDLLSQWKNGYPSANVQGGEGLGRMLNQVNEYNQDLNLLNSSNKDEATRHDMQSCAMKENSSDSHHSNLSQHPSGGLGESGLLDVSDARSLPPGKQKSINQLASNFSVHRKFQHHPMGTLDEDAGPTYGLKQPTQGRLPKDNKGPEQEPLHGSFLGYAPNMSVSSSRPSDSSINKASSPSQNMLELLHKVDQSKDQGALTHLSSGSSKQLSQSSVSQGFGLQLGPPSGRLQIPGLPLASQNAQGNINSIHPSHAGADLGEKGLLMVPTSSVQPLPYPNEDSQIQFEDDRSAGAEHPGNENPLYKATRNYYPAFSSETPSAGSQLQNKLMKASGKVAMNQHLDSSFSYNTSPTVQRGSAETSSPDASRNIQKENLAPFGGTIQQTGSCDVQERGPAEAGLTRNQMRSPQHFGMSGISREGAPSQVLHNMWTNVPASRHTLPTHYSNVPSQFSRPPQPKNSESHSQGNLDFSKGGHLSSESNAVQANSSGLFGEEPRLKETSGQVASFAKIDSATEMEESLGKTNDYPANSASKHKDTGVFGQSLKPNIFSNENNALLNQMRASKDAETDPSVRVSKRIRGPDSILNVSQAHLTAGPQNEDNVVDSLDSSTGVPSKDSRMLSVSTPTDILQRNISPHENFASQDIVVANVDASWNKSSTDCSTSVGVEHNQVVHQIAPSKFNHYGSFKDGRMMHVHNAQTFTSLRPEELPFTLVKPSSHLVSPNLEEKSTAIPIDTCRVGSTVINSAPTSEANKHLSSESLQLNVTGQHQVILGPKKRKSATYELHSWHKEISDGSQKLSFLSVAEIDWNKVANSLTEKIENSADLTEDEPPVVRSKRRLGLTTQLMQQLFYPPPANILSADATSEYECVTYAVSRVALGDACRDVCHSSDLGLSNGGLDMHSIKDKLNGDPSFAKVIEELLGKAKKLETDILRLDKSASALDLRLECQDLEKFSVINRLFKLHSRGQTDNAETASTQATVTTQKSHVQRYVIAVAPPRSFPESVQCISL